MDSLNYDLSIADGSITRPYVFKDVKVDVETTHNNRDIATSLDHQAIDGGIRNMFLFAQGERILNPEFGNNLYKYLYEPITEFVIKKIKAEIYEMFAKWEPRVSIQDVIVETYTDNNQLNVTVFYTIPMLSDTALHTFNTNINARR